MPTMSKEYNKMYYYKNRDKLLANLRKKIICDKCGMLINASSKYGHQNVKTCKLIYEIKLLRNDRDLKE